MKGCVIRHAIGTYYMEVNGSGGWSEWQSDAKVFPSVHECLSLIESFECKRLLRIQEVKSLKRWQK